MYRFTLRVSCRLRLLPLLLATGLIPACHRGTPPVSRAGSAPDLVSVGYGEREPDRVTGATATITEAEMNALRTTTVEQVLRQHVPGLLVVRAPNGETRLQLRGRTGSNGSLEPHVVIDGRPSSTRELLQLSPLEIHRVTVIKDGTAAIYGSRGGDGVVVVTTRRNRPGAY